MLRSIRTRLEYKILLLLIAVLIAGFGTYVVTRIQSESEALLHQHQEKVRLFSETIVGGIRNVMLTGKSPLTHEFLNDARRNLTFGSLTVYDRFGREVFLREGEGIRYDVEDPLLHQTLEKRQMLSTMMGEGDQEVFTRYEPLFNHPECWRCHEREPQIRGVLQLALAPGAIRTGTASEATRQMASAMGEVLATAFRTIMLGGQGEQMDTLTAKARGIAWISRIQVYSKDGYVAFGEETEEDVSEQEILALLQTHTKAHHFVEEGKKLRLFIPLQNQERCQVCHSSRFPMRGLMVIDFKMDSLKAYVRDPSKVFTGVLQATTFEGFRSIMLVGRANSVRYFMDELRAIPTFQMLHVFDGEGNERFLNPQPRMRSQLASFGEKKENKPVEFFETVNGEEHMVRLTPIPNEVRCYTCHGKNHELRAVVEVSASLKTINAEIAASKRESLVAGVVTILLVWLVIRVFMNSVVVSPVKLIESVASKVGEGDFSVQAHVGSQDEIGTLAKRINEMILGLRERFHLEKFVSRAAVDAVRGADLAGLKMGGERKLATVFFSDIRGFTSFSEKVEPERVVSMLNGILARQAAIVRQHGGDIDKFVGDELV
ncbi:MAG: adenylate/guanylate cyclase domain-containing protein, partial [Bacteroidota bacterium]